MSDFDAELMQRLIHFRAEVQKVRLSLPAPRPGCACTLKTGCKLHSDVGNMLAEGESFFEEGIWALEDGSWQAGIARGGSAK